MDQMDFVEHSTFEDDTIGKSKSYIVKINYKGGTMKEPIDVNGVWHIPYRGRMYRVDEVKRMAYDIYLTELMTNTKTKPIKEQLYLSVTKCQRCGEDHEGLPITALLNPFDSWNEYTYCPSTGQPILIQSFTRNELLQKKTEDNTSLLIEGKGWEQEFWERTFCAAMSTYKANGTLTDVTKYCADVADISLQTWKTKFGGNNNG